MVSLVTFKGERILVVRGKEKYTPLPEGTTLRVYWTSEEEIIGGGYGWRNKGTQPILPERPWVKTEKELKELLETLGTINIPGYKHYFLTTQENLWKLGYKSLTYRGKGFWLIW